MAKKRKRRKDFHEIPQQGNINCSQSPCLEPKHKIFLSHSGTQKNFTAQLCEDLTRVNQFPFFDKRLDSLPKGEEFPPLIIKAARQCWIAILVLSEEFFTRSKWPMIELNEFVQAQAADNRGLKLLPLYFGLKLDQLKDAGNQKRWRETWEKWAEKDDRIDVGKWVEALSKVLGPVNGMEYDGVDEVGFRKKVVEAVCKLIPPDVKYDVSHVQALPRLCKAISEKMDESYQISGCRGVGLFGMAGMGKTTISKVMCSENFGEFGGNVCHVEFSGNNYVELRKKVLRELSGANQEHLPNEGDKLLGLLKSRMHDRKVFLCLDNVLSENDVEEANKYLDIEYLHGSKVLVSSRSLDILKSLRLRESGCMEMPELEEQDATNAFLHYARCTRKDFNQEQGEIIKECVEVCKFTKSELGGSEFGSSERKYLPLALKVWGTHLGQVGEDPLNWIESLKTVEEHKLNPYHEPKNPLFSLLRQGYDDLDDKDRHIFLDLAMFFPRRSLVGFADHNIVEWLSIIYRRSQAHIVRSLNALRRKALLEDSVKDGLGFKIHDLYLGFARVEAQDGAFDQRRILHESNGSDIPRELLKRPAGDLWPNLERLGLYKSEVKSLTKATLDRCSNVEILQLYDCHQLVEVDVGGMENLMSLDVVGCEKLGDKFEGVWKLENLAWFRWRDIDEGLAPFSLELSWLTSLQVLHLDCVLWKHKSTDPPDLSGCTELRELTMSGFHTLESLPDLRDLFKLEKVYFRYARDAKSVFGLSSLTKLKVLSLYWCPEVTELPGLCDLIALETLEFVDVGLSEIHGLENLRLLRDLIVSSCRHLTSLNGLEYLTSLRRLDASECKKLSELPDCSNLKELEVVNLSHSGVCILRPSDFERLAKPRILKIEGCPGLFKPLVLWLSDLHLYLPWESTGSRRSCFDLCSDKVILLKSRLEVFAHYLDEAGLFPLNGSYLTVVKPKYFVRQFPSLDHILRGIHEVLGSVRAGLCEHFRLGILSLVIVTYMDRSGFIAFPAEYRRCSGIIVSFLEQLYKQMEANKMVKGHEGEHLMSLVLFILERVNICESTRVFLRAPEIYRFIERCINEFSLSNVSLGQEECLQLVLKRFQPSSNVYNQVATFITK